MGGGVLESCCNPTAAGTATHCCRGALAAFLTSLVRAMLLLNSAAALHTMLDG